MLKLETAKKVSASMNKLQKQLAVVAKKFVEGEYDDNLDAGIQKVKAAIATTDNAATAVLTQPTSGKEEFGKVIASATYTQNLDSIVSKILEVQAAGKILLAAMENENGVEDEEGGEPVEDTEEVTDDIEEETFDDEVPVEDKIDDGEELSDAEDVAGDEEPENDDEDGDEGLGSESMDDETVFEDEGEGEEPEIESFDDIEKELEEFDTQSCKTKSSKQDVVSVKKATAKKSAMGGKDNSILTQLWDF